MAIYYDRRNSIWKPKHRHIVPLWHGGETSVLPTEFFRILDAYEDLVILEEVVGSRQISLQEEDFPKLFEQVRS